MGQVNVSINQRHYRMACEDGQEEHLVQLAKDLDQRIDALREKFGEVGDMRLAIMAALTLADELTEVSTRLKHLQHEVGSLQDARHAATHRAQATEAAIIAAFGAAAERIEAVTRKLNHAPGLGAPQR